MSQPELVRLIIGAVAMILCAILGLSVAIPRIVYRWRNGLWEMEGSIAVMCGVVICTLGGIAFAALMPSSW